MLGFRVCLWISGFRANRVCRASIGIQAQNFGLRSLQVKGDESRNLALTTTSYARHIPARDERHAGF